MSMQHRIRWIDDLRAAGSPGLDWLWQGYLVRRGVTLLTSREKLGKTTLISVLLSRMTLEGSGDDGGDAEAGGAGQ